MNAMVAIELPPEITASFVAEARSYLPQIADSLGNVGDEALLAEAYRFAHTIKSSAAMMGHLGLSQVAELLEGDLEAIQLGEPVTTDWLDQLVRSVGRIGRLLNAVAGEAVDIDAVLAEEVADRLSVQEGLEGQDGTAGLRGQESGVSERDRDEAFALPWTVTAVDGCVLEPGSRDGGPGTADSGQPSAVGGEGRPAGETAPLAAHEAPPAALDEPAASQFSSCEDGHVAAPLSQAVSPVPEAVDSPPPAQPGEGGGELPMPPHPQAGSRWAPDHELPAGQTGAGAPAGDPAAVAALVEQLAEAALSLGRDVSPTAQELMAHRRAIADLLRAFDRAIGAESEAARPAGLLSRADAPGPEAATAAGEPRAPTLERSEELAPSVARGTRGTPLVRAANESPEAAEIDPSFDPEVALRQNLEAELRFQIEEEIRTRLAAEAPAQGVAARPAVSGALRVAQAEPPAAASGGSTRRAGGPARPKPASSDVSIDPELREVFQLEAAEHLKRIDAEVAALAAKPGDLGSLRALRRSVHTLKGAAAMMGFDAVAALAHSLEERLERVGERSGDTATLEPAAYATLFHDLDRLERLIRDGRDDEDTAADGAAGAFDPTALAGEEAPAVVEAEPETADGGPEMADGGRRPEDSGADAPEVDDAAGTGSAEPVSAPAGAEGGPLATVPVRLSRLDSLLTLAGETSVSLATWPAVLAAAASARAELRRTLGRVELLLSTIEADRIQAAGSALGWGQGSREAVARVALFPGGAFGSAGANGATPNGALHADFDPLELDRYTAADYVARALAEITAETQSVERELAAALERAAELVTEHRRQAKEMQDRLLEARLVPLEDLAGRLQRAAQGVALRRGKEVRFTFEGGHVAVDRAILDAVADALLHLVRNAVDHGIEAPGPRVAAGKSAAGLVAVRARQEQSEVWIDVSDDGGGVDPQQILAAARAAGLEVDGLGPDQAVRLMFHPGLSTADQTDDISGRGVGLDAVREAIARVRGGIEVASEVGRGTTFSLRLPVTLAQARVVMVDVAGNAVAVPAAAVRRIARLRDVEVEGEATDPVVRDDGAAFRLGDLASALGLPDEQARLDNPAVLLVEAAGERVAWTVAAVGAHQEVVVRSAGSHLRALRGVAGTTLLQDGRVALLLHLPDLLEAPTSAAGLSGSVRPSASSASSASSGAAGTPGGRRAGRAVRGSLRVLVVDDSPTIRKLLVRALKDVGWQPREAKDGAEALEGIRVDPPDVVLADIEMPRLDGYGLLAALRGRPETAELPVIMLTSRSADRHRRRALELGANGYLTKPYRPADVVSTVRRACGAPERAAPEAGA